MKKTRVVPLVAFTAASLSSLAHADRLVTREAGPSRRWVAQGEVSFTPRLVGNSPGEAVAGVSLARELVGGWGVEAAIGRGHDTGNHARLRAQHAFAFDADRRHRFALALGPGVLHGSRYGTVVRAESDAGYELHTSWGLVLGLRVAYAMPLHTPRLPSNPSGCAGAGCGARFEAGSGSLLARWTAGLAF